MHYRKLGNTGLSVSVLSFGAGPISQLMIGDDRARQRSVSDYAIERGVNWFDTAATYGGGKSEANLGRVLHELGNPAVHVATKVRLIGDDLHDVEAAVRRSVTASLDRLSRRQITLLQLHNSITMRRGDEPTSINQDDVLARGGIADTFEKLRDEGITRHIGLTGIGQPAAPKEVIASGRFQTFQTPYHLLNPSAGQSMPPSFDETNYGNVISDCARAGMSVFAIRILAGGALLENPPSPHTLKTPFFPIELYERDRQRAARLRKVLSLNRSLAQEAIRFALDHEHISSAIIGWSCVEEIDDALSALEAPPSSFDWTTLLEPKQRSTSSSDK
jgi:aryl-alcohol dehydrogenase-like predicted oxidoreductase